MVYESDFYTSRRPYSSRPNISSYSVTNGLRTPGLGKGQTFHHNVPAIGHKRIVVIAPSSYTVCRSRPSALIGEYDRIYHKVRPSLAYQPTEDYLNSRSIVSFDDETRSIRAQTADLLRKIHTPVPRAQRPLPLPGDLYYSRSELPITDRITSDTYIDRLLSGTRNVARDINIMSHYEEPARRCNNIGQGHLACMSFARGRPISKRRNLAEGDDYVKNDINMLSHYGRLRSAAAAAATPPTEPAYEPSLHRPPTKSAVTGSWKSNAPRNAANQNKSANLTAGDEFDAAQDRKQRRRDAVEAAAQREVAEEKRRKDDVSRQDELAQQAMIAREQEIERKAREAEEAAQRKEEEDRMEAERLAREEAERLQQEEEERLAAEELRLLEQEEARKKQEEDEKKAKKAKKEAEKKAKEEAERKAKEAEEQRIREEEEKRAKEEQERIAREEEEKIAREEEERKVKEEVERLALEDAKRLEQEEEERKNQEEAARAKEAEERLAEEAAAAAAADVIGQPEVSADAVEAEEVAPTEEPTEEVQEPVVEEPSENVEEESPAIEEAPADEEEVDEE